jgi:serine phosphatase RsbU (regulator of sigma subunit)
VIKFECFLNIIYFSGMKYMRFNILFFVFITFLIAISSNSFAKDSRDSLLNCIKTSKDTSKAQLYNELCLQEIEYSIDKAIDYANKALEFATKYENQKEIMYAYDGLGTAYYYKGELPQALDFSLKSLEISRKSRADNYKRQEAYVLNRMGIIYKLQGKYEQAIKCYQQSLTIYESLKIPLQMGLATANIGNTYLSMGVDFNKALKYYEQALQLFEKAGSKTYMAMVLGNIGLIYKEKNQNMNSLKFFYKSLAIYEEIKSISGIANTKRNISSVYFDQKKYSLALSYGLSAYAIYENQGDNVQMAMALTEIGRSHEKLLNYPQAILDFQKALKLFKESGMKKEVADAYKDIANLQNELKDFQSAFQNMQVYSTLKDSLLNSQYLKATQEAEAKFETVKKDKEILLQKKDIETKDLQAKRKNILLLGVVIIAFLIIGFSFVLYRQFAEKKKANLLLAEQNDEIKKQRDQIFQQKKEMTDSIHYASRIQRAVLPSTKLLEENGLQYFILYKPRDIVSGDFYWINQKDNKIIMAAADCTGHGVPGAFMSMLGITLLNEIVSKGDFHNPAEILNQLRTLIVKSLHQSGKSEETKDGMDISMIMIDKDTSTVQFAGAFNSLYLIRGTELQEANADRMPVGYHDKLDIPFTNSELQLQKGDSLYIFSDGYIDQFGGENGKKFMAKKFKQLLLNMQDKPMDTQRELLDKNIIDWRGELDQIDDILVMGVKV